MKYGTFDLENHEHFTMKIVTACVENVGCVLKLIFHEILVSVTNERGK